MTQIYYVSQTTGDDAHDGITPGSAWKNAPGMTAYTGSVVLLPGDIIYFNSAETWLVSGEWGLHVKGGVAYVGDEWGNGTRAAIRAKENLKFSVIDVTEDHPSFPTIVKGFDVDANNKVNNGVGINHPYYTGALTGAIKRIENCIVHNNWSSTALGEYTYGIIISNWGGANRCVENVEILNSAVHTTSRDALCLYPGDNSPDAVVKNITVRGNIVYDTGLDPDYGAGAGIAVKGYVQDACIENNYVYNTKGAGVFVNSNESKHYGTGPTNIHIRNNIVNISAIHGSIRIYDGAKGNDPKDVKIYGNIVYNNLYGGLLISRDLGNTNSLRIYNNTFYNAPVIIENTAATFKPFEFINNIVYSTDGTPVTGSQSFTRSSNNLITDPLFKDTANLPTGFTGTFGVDLAPNTDGLSMQSASPAIDAGVPLLSSYSTSVNTVSRLSDSAWDIGAYENGSIV